MRYKINGSIIPMGESESGESEDILVDIITSAEYVRQYGGIPGGMMQAEHICNAKYCRADVLREGIAGIFAVPRKTDLTGKRETFGFYLTKNKLVFIDDGEFVRNLIDHIVIVQQMEKTFIAHFFFEFMEYLVKEDGIFLQNYEERLSELEETLLEGTITDFDRKILIIRKEILALQSYYEQLIDMSDMFQENQNQQLSQEDCRLFGIYSRRADRLYDNAKTLKEYSLQLREMYESQIDIRQNAIMKVLTIVTTIFMPLTLIAGWYGMNFVNMPELKSSYGYLMIIIISVITILMEVWIFKIKKWF